MLVCKNCGKEISKYLWKLHGCCQSCVPVVRAKRKMYERPATRSQARKGICAKCHRQDVNLVVGKHICIRCEQGIV